MTPDSAGEWLEIGPGTRVPLELVTVRAETSGGPGGQHANRSRTKIVVSLRLDRLSALDAESRNRLIGALGSVVRSSASRFRSQAQNRDAALEQLRLRLEAALVQPEVRRPTRATKSSQRRRLDDKRARGRQKQHRRTLDDE